MPVSIVEHAGILRRKPPDTKTVLSSLVNTGAREMNNPVHAGAQPAAESVSRRMRSDDGYHVRMVFSVRRPLRSPAREVRYEHGRGRVGGDYPSV